MEALVRPFGSFTSLFYSKEEENCTGVFAEKTIHQSEVRFFYKVAMKISEWIPQFILNKLYLNGKGYIAPRTESEAIIFNQSLIGRFKNIGQMHLVDFSNAGIAEIMYDRGGFTIKNLNDEYKIARTNHKEMEQESLIALAEKLYSNGKFTILNMYDPTGGKQITDSLIKHFIEKKIMTIKDFIDHGIYNVRNWPKVFTPEDLILNADYSKKMIETSSTDDESKKQTLTSFMTKLTEKINHAVNEEKQHLIRVAAQLHSQGIIVYDRLICNKPEDKESNSQIYQLMKTIAKQGELALSQLIADVISILIGQGLVKTRDLIENHVFKVPNWHHFFDSKDLAENPAYAKELINQSHESAKSRISAMRHFAAQLGEKLEGAEEGARDEMIGYLSTLRRESIIHFEQMIKRPNVKDTRIEVHNNQIETVLDVLYRKTEVAIEALADSTIVNFFKKEVIKLEELLHLRSKDKNKFKKVVAHTLDGSDEEAKATMLAQLGDQVDSNDVGFIIMRAVRHGWIQLENFAEDVRAQAEKYFKCNNPVQISGSSTAPVQKHKSVAQKLGDLFS